MKMTIFYFTGTGNSLSVAKKIGGEDVKLISIPQVIDSRTNHYKDDVIGLVFPVYYYSTPAMVRRFLKKVKLEADYTFVISTHGGGAGAALWHAQKFARLKFDYAADVRMVSNYLPMGSIEDEIKIASGFDSKDKIESIVSDIAGRKQ